MSNYLNDLEKIANQVLTEQEMNPDPQPEMTPEEVQEAQTGQAAPVEGLSPEEAALKQQLDEEIMMSEEQAEEERAEQHEMVDRALLEGAAEQAIAEMADEEIKDILIEKAASDLLGLGALAKLVDIATEDYDGHVKQAATQTLDYMSVSNENFVDGLNKVADELFGNDSNADELFSSDGVDYVFEQLAKLSDYNSLSKVANDEDVEALAVIVENEADKINAAKDIVTEAYEEAIKEIAKEDIKESIENSGEYDEEFLEQTAKFNPKSVAKGVGLFGSGAATGVGGTLLYQRLLNGEISPEELTDEELAVVEEIAEQEAVMEQTAGYYDQLGMYKEAKGIRKKLSNAKEYHKQKKNHKSINKEIDQLKKRVKKGDADAFQTHDRAKAYSGERRRARQALKENTEGAQDYRDLKYMGIGAGTAGTLGAGAYAGGRALSGRNPEEEMMVQTANFYNELGMYKEAKGKGLKNSFNKAKDYRKQKTRHKSLEKDMRKGYKGRNDSAESRKAYRELAAERQDAKKTLKENKEGAKAYRNFRNAGVAATGVAGLGAAGLANRNRTDVSPSNHDEAMIQTANFYNELGMYKQANPLFSVAGRGLGKAKNLFGKAKGNVKGAVDYTKNRSKFNKTNKDLKNLSQQGKIDMSNPSQELKNLRQTKRDTIQGMRDNKQAYQNTMKAGVAGTVGLGAANSIYNAGKTKGEEQAQQQMQPYPVPVPYSPGMYQHAGVEHYYGMEKKANIVNKTKKVINKAYDSAKNVKANKKLLKEREHDLNQFIENSKLTGPAEPGRLTELTDDLHRIENDIMLGSAIRYGVPAAGVTAGSIVAGKKLSDSKKKRALENEVGEMVNPIHKEAAVGALMPAWRNIKDLGGNGFKKVTDNFSSIDKMGDIGTSVDGINTDYTARNSDPRLSKYFKEYQNQNNSQFQG